MNKKNLIVIGMSRNGTTLTIALIDILSDSVCLSKPYWQDNLFEKR